LLIEEVKRLALEAVIAKKKGSTYEPGSCSGAWVQLRVQPAVSRRA
jgi:ATP-dependent DNA ligase